MEEELFSLGLDVVGPLGRGSQGLVLHCRRIDSDQHLAVKAVLTQKVQSHPHVIKLLQTVPLQTKTLLLLELASCSLRAKLESGRKNKQRLSEEEVSLFIRSVLLALEHLHLRDIVHRDLKPDNLLLCHETLKVADFGLSVQTHEHHQFESQQCGTVLYMAPELLSQKQYHKPVDLWSLGIIMYELLTNQHPFPQQIQAAHLAATNKKPIVLDTLPTLSPKHSLMSAMALDFFHQLVRIQPSERYSADIALKHPWITRNLDSHIPLTIEQKITCCSVQQRMLQIIKAMAILNRIKASHNEQPPDQLPSQPPDEIPSQPSQQPAVPRPSSKHDNQSRRSSLNIDDHKISFARSTTRMPPDRPTKSSFREMLHVNLHKYRPRQELLSQTNFKLKLLTLPKIVQKDLQDRRAQRQIYPDQRRLSKKSSFENSIQHSQDFPPGLYSSQVVDMFTSEHNSPEIRRVRSRPKVASLKIQILTSSQNMPANKPNETTRGKIEMPKPCSDIPGPKLCTDHSEKPKKPQSK